MTLTISVYLNLNDMLHDKFCLLWLHYQRWIIWILNKWMNKLQPCSGQRESKKVWYQARWHPVCSTSKFKSISFRLKIVKIYFFISTSTHRPLMPGMIGSYNIKNDLSLTHENQSTFILNGLQLTFNGNMVEDPIYK